MPNVSGPTGPRPLTGSTGVSTPSTTTPAAPAATPDTSSAGWTARTGARGTVDTSVRAPSVSSADIQASLPHPVRQAVTANIDRLTSRIETTLNHDAMSLARGRTPVREGDPLTDAQQTELRNAATDFVKDLPIGALSPEVAQTVQARLSAAGIPVRDIASTRLGDLGQIGGDIARDLVKGLRSNSPAAFYGLAAGAAAVAGYAAWTGGSQKLASLGIKPEVKQSFFDSQLEVKLRGDWQAHFKDFKATATVIGRHDFGNGSAVSGSVVANSQTGFESANLQYNLSRPDLNLSASAYANINRGGLQSAGGSITYQPNDAFRLSAGIDQNFQTNRTTATAEATWRLRDNIDFALSASHDSRGDSRVGVGLRIPF